MTRAGYEEETYFTWSYSPIVDDTGAIDGVFCAVTETTPSILGARRLRVLAEVAERAVPDDAPRAVAPRRDGGAGRRSRRRPVRAALRARRRSGASLVAAAGVTGRARAERLRTRGRVAVAGIPPPASS